MKNPTSQFRRLVAVVFLAGLPASATAQVQLPPVKRELRMNMLGAGDPLLALQPSESTQQIPQPRWDPDGLRGAAIGFAVGVAVGGLASLVFCTQEDTSLGEFGCFVILTVPPALLGAAIGYAVGSSKQEGLRVGFAPQRDGRFAVGLSVRF